MVDLSDRLNIANTRLANARAAEIEKRIEETYGEKLKNLNEEI